PGAPIAEYCDRKRIALGFQPRGGCPECNLLIREKNVVVEVVEHRQDPIGIESGVLHIGHKSSVTSHNAWPFDRFLPSLDIGIGDLGRRYVQQFEQGVEDRSEPIWWMVQHVKQRSLFDLAWSTVGRLLTIHQCNQLGLALLKPSPYSRGLRRERRISLCCITQDGDLARNGHLLRKRQRFHG